MLQETLNLLRRQFLGLNRVLSTVMELVNDGLGFDEEQALLQYAARLLINNHNFQFCTLHIYENNMPMLRVAVSTESILDPSRINEESSPWVQTCEHLAREVYDRNDAHLLKRHAGDTVYYCMPFVYRNEILGMLSANSPGFDENHPKLISIFCRILTSVLINARQSQRLSDEVIKRTSELETAWRVAEDSLQAKSQFLTNMSHEYLTPLNAIVGSASLLQETDLSTEQKEYVNSVAESSETLKQMVLDMLDFSQTQTGDLEIRPQAIELKTLIDHTLQALQKDATKKGLALETLLPSDLPTIVQADPRRLRQVLENLLSNAIKFTASGRVTLDINCVRETFDQATVKFSVLDTGIGIPPENQKTIFDAFSQADTSNSRKFQGTGLGLTISQHLVNLMGGHIKVSSEQGRGSQFTFSLKFPVVQEASESAYQDLMDRRISKGAETEDLKTELAVLLVEDNIINQKLAARLLEKMGCRVDIANDGRIAVDMFSRSPYDVVFMDCQMPNMDGFEATTKIREMERGNRTPIIALTANSLPEDRARSFEAGMDEFLTKPIIREKLQDALQRWAVAH